MVFETKGKGLSGTRIILCLSCDFSQLDCLYTRFASLRGPYYPVGPRPLSLSTMWTSRTPLYHNDPRSFSTSGRFSDELSLTKKSTVRFRWTKIY